jgi:hypothetical protein
MATVIENQDMPNMPGRDMPGRDMPDRDMPDITDSPVDPYEGMTPIQIQKIVYENKFNMVIMNIFNHITSFYQHSDITNAQDQMNDVLMQSPDGPICCFLKYVYLNDTYRQKLLDMNEEFFLDSGRIDDPDVAKDKAIIERIFSFKKIWGDFNRETKHFIMRGLRGLVLISTRYIQYLD